MNTKQLFQYTVIVHKYKDQTGAAMQSNTKIYDDSEIIIQPKFELAKSEKDLVFKITREIPEEFAGDPDNIQILVRPF
jgi:hypothetical protein